MEQTLPVNSWFRDDLFDRVCQGDDDEVDTEIDTEVDTEGEDQLYATRSSTTRIREGFASTQVNLERDDAPASSDTGASFDEREAGLALEGSGDAASTDSYALSNGIMDVFDFGLFGYGTNGLTASTFLNANSPTRSVHSDKRTELATPPIFHEPINSFEHQLLQILSEDMGDRHMVSG
ncbi:hypothetical protein LTR35_017237 [Friedmanniomyces endolithicus]|uniref:Uncharacterized protein n=1 Tax=Friedmanniomyces endolithicus TaxID=329885 RepID=A0A4U0TTY8_9PEZI|nr:hypothetical protein LTR35_017237 [Friedmanniomyces endolithicus]KAK0269531.1 hypothetical protein LTS00_017246 [Friedmanniomyces endolithicus]KAK0302254.1 hypothetical protein LTR01_008881 [Friedmanniomyces endolithicus]KAK0822910.1 hypothetical protein LTR73_008947 [Friedmanniomyces endolithicus]KAK0973089.1 hypothetical protein LTR54_017411 [Friedmanniomyces endolithicus]